MRSGACIPGSIARRSAATSPTPVSGGAVVMNTASASGRAFAGVSALVFGASAAITVAWCSSMSAMGGMQMPGGWTMSMAWMRMPDQTWLEAAALFLGMWVLMMVAMMMPSLIPLLSRYR